MSQQQQQRQQQSVAIFGTGLHTLVTAYFLAKFNYNVTIYDYLSPQQSYTQYSVHSNLVSTYVGAQPFTKPVLYMNTLYKVIPFMRSYMHCAYNTYYPIKFVYWRKMLQHCSLAEFSDSYTLLNQLVKYNNNIYNNINNTDHTDTDGIHHIYCSSSYMTDIQQEQHYRRHTNTSVNNNERIIDLEQLTQREPSLHSATKVEAALYAPSDYITDLQQYAQNMYTQCTKQLKIQFRYNTYAQSLNVQNNTVQSIQCSDNTVVQAHKYIITDPIILHQLLPSYYNEHAIQLVRQHTLRFNTRAKIAAAVSKPEHYIDITQCNNNEVVVTFQREVLDTPSITPHCIKHLYTMNDEIIRNACLSIMSIYPSIHVNEISKNGRQQPIIHLTCITPDSKPVIGQIQPYNNLYVNLVYGMYSSTLIHSSALLLAQIIEKQPTMIDASTVDPNRAM